MPAEVEISGIQGVNSGTVNGVYERTAEWRCGSSIFRKSGGHQWLVRTSAGWMVQDTADKEADNRRTRFHAKGDLQQAVSPLNVPLETWEKWDGEQWEHNVGMFVGPPKARVRSG